MKTVFEDENKENQMTLSMGKDGSVLISVEGMGEWEGVGGSITLDKKRVLQLMEQLGQLSKNTDK